MVSLQYELSDEQQGLNLQWKPWHIYHNYMVILQYELSDEQQRFQYD